ncbi:hypothetical protein M011DRAFT_65413 [Sporormia fimetaria CBS 119925]|uniref:C2H2-type domain-containing protein n=1 Tax=Sporormia fimetaria CBS 119925 TaxID=1340428 RepID=A0A6A6V965_9PLEO|nr:hypothetical protein M011DRAFT_65413 [Sporormia fimetaria CBS 119925]
MLSTQPPSSIQSRRAIHRRQNSTPAAFEAPAVRPLATNQRQQRHNRSGMSLDLRGLNLDMRVAPFHKESSTVSNTNIGQPQQHFMQVAQPHSQPQPGPHLAFMPSPVQFRQSPSSPRTPHRPLRARTNSHFSTPQLTHTPHLTQTPQLTQTPAQQPSQEAVQKLHEHIQSVYGSHAQVFINILPTPEATPQKPAPLPSQAHVDRMSPVMSPNFSTLGDINLAPTRSAMTFDLDNPDLDAGYDSSSAYTSDTLSPSPASSPRQRPTYISLEGIREEPIQQNALNQAPALLPSPMPSNLTEVPPLFPVPVQSAALPADLEVDASLEYTGISAEEVARYIGEQDPVNNKWTCLYPECAKVFGRRENIRAHVQTHLGDRQYRCNGCGKCFVRQHDLKRHAKIHTGNKPHVCPCGAGFARQDALTRHRQRGMCVGGFPDAVRRPAKRGRPKKNRPEMEERLQKANKTRRALVSAASSVSAESPSSASSIAEQSPRPLELSPQPLPEYDPAMQNLLPDIPAGFIDPVSAAPGPFSYPIPTFSSQSEVTSANYTSFTSDVAPMNVLQEISQPNNTPPMSPDDCRAATGDPAKAVAAKSSVPSSPQKPVSHSSSPSRSSLQSHPFSTPPTSPAAPKEEIDDIFTAMPDENCASQFELEMKAMDEFTSLDSASYVDSNTYEFLDFGM